MQIRWLAILACLLFTACSNPANDKVAKNETEPAKPVPRKPVDVEVKTDTEPELAPEAKPDAKAEIAPEAKAELAAETKPETTVEPNAEPGSPAEQFEAVKSRFETARSEFMVEYREAPEAERSKMVAEKYPKPEDFADEFLRIAADHPEDDAAFESLLWVAGNVRTGEPNKKAYESLFAHHIENEKLAGICTSLGYSTPSQEVEDRLNLLIEQSPHDAVKAAATFSLARYLKTVENAKTFVAENPDSDRYDDEDTLAYINAFEPQSQVIETLYQTLISDYAELKPFEQSKRTYKSMAEGALFEMTNLSIGLTAPDIEGTDFDGTSFKLSDYRGKVVVLDFWGDW